MRCCVPLAVLLYRSVVYVKGFDPKKIRGAKKRQLSEHIKLWNIIVNALTDADNDYKIISCNDITEYISNNKTLSSSLSVSGLSENDDRYINIGDHEDVIILMRMIVSEIDVLFFSKNCDYKKLFVYIRALHNLPKCLFSAEDRNKISKTDAITYMKRELESNSLKCGRNVYEQL